MKLVRLEVTNWRGLPAASLSFGEGITVVGGPNESGKSSLRAALRAALLLPMGTRGEGKLLESNRPWETALNPTVELEFVLDGTNCLVKKQFLRKKQWASLHCDTRLKAEDDEVQSTINDMLGTSAQWIDALWGEQGEKTERELPEGVKGRLASTAQDTVMPQVAELESLIENEYLEYWTAKTGKPNKTVQTIRQATITAEGVLEKLKADIAEADLKAVELNTRIQACANLKIQWTKSESALQEGQKSLGAWESYARAKTEFEKAELVAKNLDSWLKNWKETVTRVNELWTKSQSWMLSRGELKQKQGAEPVRAEIEVLAAKQKYLQLSIANTHHQSAAAIAVPEGDELKTLELLERTLLEIAARLKMGELQAKLLAEADLKLTVTRDGQAPETFSLSTDEVHAWSAEQGFNLILPGVARLEVQSGSPDVAKDVEQREKLQKQLADALATWNAADSRELQQRKSDKDSKLLQYRKVEPLQLHSARSAVADAEELDALSLEQRDAKLAELPAAIKVAETRWTEQSAVYKALAGELETLDKNNPTGELTATYKNLLQLWSADVPFKADAKLTFPDVPTSEWFESLQSYAPAWEIKTAELRAAAEQKKSDIIRPDGDEFSQDILAKLKFQADEQRNSLEELQKSIAQTTGLIAGQGDLHSRKVQAEESLAKAQNDERRVNLNAASVFQLHEAFITARDRLQKDVVAPLQDRVAKHFATITSGYYSGVSFDPQSLKLNGVSTAAVSAVPLQDISFGTREQLSLLTRLSLATLLAESKSRHVVILDDNLVHTDSARMVHACGLLQEAAQHCQIVIFTCHPERYAQIVKKEEIVMAGR